MSIISKFFKQKIHPETQFQNWVNEGKPFPPPHIVKQQTIQEYQKKYNLNTLVETGTYLGDMVAAQQDHFQTIYSIELSERLHKRAQRKFRRFPGIILKAGDSGTVLPEIVAQLKNPALFWLDGHYSGGITAKGNKECPVIDELNAIFDSKIPHIVLIDDARLFNGTHDYPTIQTLQSICQNNQLPYHLNNENDILRLTPSGI